MPEPINWAKSSFSGSGTDNSCIELASLGGRILLRESDRPGEVLTTDRERLRALLAAVRAGEFDHLVR